MQGRGATPSPIGVIYITSMHRPDAALALGSLYASEVKRQSKTAAVCVVGAGLNTAIYCDIVARFFIGQAQGGNQQLPVGLAATEPLPPDPPMIRAALERRNEKGDLQYNRSIRKLTDTSQAEAMIRNGVSYNAASAMVLSAPATSLARSLDLLGVVDFYKSRVRRLVVVDSGETQRDVPALRKVLAEFPAPIYLCGKEVGESLLFPASSLETEFTWAAAHPVVDAYRAARTMPYDAPSHDLAGIHYAITPASGFFQESAGGSVTVSDAGVMQFAEGRGNVKRLTPTPDKRAELLQGLIAAAASRPAAPRGRG